MQDDPQAAAPRNEPGHEGVDEEWELTPRPPPPTFDRDIRNQQYITYTITTRLKKDYTRNTLEIKDQLRWRPWTGDRVNLVELIGPKKKRTTSSSPL